MTLAAAFDVRRDVPLQVLFHRLQTQSAVTTKLKSFSNQF
jgi:hypothetical protein